VVYVRVLSIRDKVRCSQAWGTGVVQPGAQNLVDVQFCQVNSILGVPVINCFSSWFGACKIDAGLVISGAACIRVYTNTSCRSASHIEKLVTVTRMWEGHFCSETGNVL
jgi:hypothetical protein